MKDFNNYIDKNSVELLIEGIENNLKVNDYLSALTMSLIIPDILGKVAFPNKKSKTSFLSSF